MEGTKLRADAGPRCILSGCTGTYERREILHCVERTGNTICIDHVPALVCSVCGDVQFEVDTMRRLQTLLAAPGPPDKHLPAYEFNRSSAAA